MMTKTQAVELFGDVKTMTKILGYKKPVSIYQWPNNLKQEQVDRVLGAALRFGYTSDELAEYININ